MTSRSSQLFARARNRIPGGVNSPVRAFPNVGGEPFFVERAAGSRIWDVDGKEYVDYVGSWGPAILGHAPKVVVDAVRDAAAHGLSFGIPNPFEVELADLICQWMPSIEKVRMVNSGTEAAMSCVRLARDSPDATKLLNSMAVITATPIRFWLRPAVARSLMDGPIAREFRKHLPSSPFLCRSTMSILSGKRSTNIETKSRRSSWSRCPRTRGFIFQKRIFCRSCARNVRHTARF